MLYFLLFMFTQFALKQKASQHFTAHLLGLIMYLINYF